MKILGPPIFTAYANSIYTNIIEHGLEFLRKFLAIAMLENEGYLPPDFDKEAVLFDAIVRAEHLNVVDTSEQVTESNKLLLNYIGVTRYYEKALNVKK